jgi:hypothetical protein
VGGFFRELLAYGLIDYAGVQSRAEKIGREEFVSLPPDRLNDFLSNNLPEVIQYECDQSLQSNGSHDDFFFFFFFFFFSWADSVLNMLMCNFNS